MKILNVLDLDNNGELAQHGTFHDAKHIQVTKDNTAIELENGFDNLSYLDRGKYCGKIETPDKLFIFRADETKLYIYIVDETIKLYTTIEDSRYYNNHIHGTYTFNYKRSIIITFGTRERGNVPEMLIIDTSVEYDNIKLNTKEYNNILLYPNYFPVPVTVELINAYQSGSLNTGIYFISMCYEDENKNLSPFISLSKPININTGMEDISNSFNNKKLSNDNKYVKFETLVYDTNTYPSFNPFCSCINFRYRVYKDNEIIYETENVTIDNYTEQLNKVIEVDDSKLKIQIVDENSDRGSNNNPDSRLDTIVIKSYINEGSRFEYDIQVVYESEGFNSQIGTSQLYYGKYDGDYIYSTVQSYDRYFDVYHVSNTDITNINSSYISKITNKPAGKSIDIQLRNLNTYYNKLHIAIVYYAEKSLKATKLTNTIYFNEKTLNYNIANIDNLSDIDINQITVDNMKYIHSSASTVVNDKLLLAKLQTQEINIAEFQRITNEIIIDYSTDIKLSIARNNNIGVINTYSDTLNLYQYRPYKTDEVYNWYIGYKSKKGGYLCVNHIPYNDKSNMDAYVTTNKYYNIEGLDGKIIKFYKFPSTVTVENKLISVLGIKVKNVIIPDHIAEICSGWEIFYAYRSPENITRLGQAFTMNAGNSIAYSEKAGDPEHYRETTNFMSFDLWYNKYPSNAIKELKQVGSFNTKAIIDIGNGDYKFNFKSIYNRYNNSQITPVNDLYYVSGIDTTKNDRINIYDNKGEIVYLNNGLYEVVTTNDGTNIYNDLFNQTLISTGIIYSSGTTSSSTSYGGDITFSDFTMRLTDNGNQRLVVVLLESRFNLDLRHQTIIPPKLIEDEEEIPEFRLIYPQTSWEYIRNMIDDKGSYLNDELGNSYDVTYNKLNDLQNPYIDKEQMEHTFDNRIIISNSNNSESTRLGWRIFKPNSYYDIAFDRGDIINIIGVDKKLYIQLRYGLYLAQIKDILKLNNTNDVWLGSAELFDRPPIEIMYDEVGGIGCKDVQSSIYTKYGYIVADKTNNAIYIIGDKATDITKKHFKNWFHNQCINNTEDNTIIIGDDINSHNRLLININNKTVSYHMEIQGLISFHDYDIVDLASNRQGSYVINNNLLRFNNNYTALNSYIDINFTSEPLVSKIFKAVIFQTQYYINNKLDVNKTISNIMIYNDTQCSGLLPINNKNVWYDNANGKFISNTWYYNEFSDLVIDDKLPFLTDNQPNDNINNNIDWFNKSKFISNFIIIRLEIINNNTTNKRNIKFLNLSTQITKNNR